MSRITLAEISNPFDLMEGTAPSPDHHANLHIRSRTKPPEFSTEPIHAFNEYDGDRQGLDLINHNLEVATQRSEESSVDDDDDESFK